MGNRLCVRCPEGRTVILRSGATKDLRLLFASAPEISATPTNRPFDKGKLI